MGDTKLVFGVFTAYKLKRQYVDIYLLLSIVQKETLASSSSLSTTEGI